MTQKVHHSEEAWYGYDDSFRYYLLDLVDEVLRRWTEHEVPKPRFVVIDLGTIFREAKPYVEKVLKGAKAEDVCESLRDLPTRLEAQAVAERMYRDIVEYLEREGIEFDGRAKAKLQEVFLVIAAKIIEFSERVIEEISW